MRLSYTVSDVGPVNEIRRGIGSHDRRMKTVELTREGARLIAAVEPAVRQVQDRFPSRLPGAERRAFMNSLTRLTKLNNEYSRAPLRIVHARNTRLANSPCTLSGYGTIGLSRSTAPSTCIVSHQVLSELYFVYLAERGEWQFGNDVNMLRRVNRSFQCFDMSDDRFL
jgi:hypothetical protein